MGYYKNLAKIPAIILCASVAGCASPYTQYKDVMQDKFQFLQTNFAPAKAQPGIVAYINGKDAKPLSFSKIIYKIIPHVSSASNEMDKIEKENTTTIINAGGPLFTSLEEDTVNHVASRTTLSLSYRGILTLRSQWLQPGSVYASFVSEATELTEFSDASAIKPGSEITYAYTAGTTAIRPNLKKYKFTCKAGSEIEAFTINKNLEGRALKLGCQTFDEFGAAIDRVDMAYLEKYGFALPTKHSTATYTTDFEVSDVRFL